MSQALEEAAGPEVRARVTFQQDPTIVRLVTGWPAAFDNSRAHRLGLDPDPDFLSIVRQYLDGRRPADCNPLLNRHDSDLKGIFFMVPNTAVDGASQEEHAAHRIYAKVFRRIVPFLILCYVISYLDRVNIAFAKLQMQQSRNFSETVFGLGAGVFFMGYFLFGLPSNLLLVKFGARNWIASILVCRGLLSRIVHLHHHARHLLRVALLPGRGRSRLLFRRNFVCHLLVSGPPPRQNPRALCLRHSHCRHLRQSALRLDHDRLELRLPPARLAMDVPRSKHPRTLCRTPRLVRSENSVAATTWLTSAEKEFLAMEDSAADADRTRSQPHSISEVLRSTRVWTLCLIYFAIVMGQYGLTFWMPTLIKTTGVTGIQNVELPFGHPVSLCHCRHESLRPHADRHRERRWHLIIPAACAALGFVVAAAYPHSTVISLAFLFAACGVLTCTALFWSLPTSVLSGTAAAAGIALINSVGNIAGFVSPSLIGWLKDATHKNESACSPLPPFCFSLPAHRTEFQPGWSTDDA